MYRKLSIALCLLGLTTLSNVAPAGVLGAASDFNVFVFQNDTSSNGDAQGRVGVGGTASFSSYQINGHNRSGTSGTAADPYGLIVGGSLAFSNGTINMVNRNAFAGSNANLSGFTVNGTLNVNGNTTLSNGTINGNLTYGGSLTKSGTTITGTTSHTTTTAPLNFATAQSDLNNRSSVWSALANNGSINYNSTSKSLTLTGTSATLDVFNLNQTFANDLSNASSLTITAPTGATVLVNVAGTSDKFGGSSGLGITINGANQQSVLYNFYQATTLSSSNVAILGSLLAPKASFNFSNGNINGTLIVNNLTGTGQENDYLFTGNLPPPVPELSSWLGLSGMMGAVMLPLTRRKRCLR